jgi:putative ABC transport system substrate-binding protein
VNVTLATATAPALAAKRATATIPIVFIAADPLGAGLVASLARPGANLTGLSAASPDLSTKRLQLLTEAVPALNRVGILANPTHPATAAELRELGTAARHLKVQLRTFEIRTPADVEPAFAAMVKGAVGAVVVLTDPVLLFSDLAIVRLAAQHRLPLIAESTNYTRAGGLMSYGTSFPDLSRRAVRVRRPDPQGRQTRRTPRGAADEIRAGDQSQDREGARPHDPAVAPATRRAGDRVAGGQVLHYDKHCDEMWDCKT